MAKTTLKVEQAPNGVTLHFTGPHLAKANTQLITECFTALFNCAEKHSCFEKGLSAVCLSTIAEHDQHAGCISKAFGFAVQK